MVPGNKTGDLDLVVQCDVEVAIDRVSPYCPKQRFIYLMLLIFSMMGGKLSFKFTFFLIFEK